MRLQTRFAFITGGGRGIGSAIALAFAREGCDVVVAARTDEQVQTVAANIHSECGVKAFAVVCDVSQPESVNAAFARAYAESGRRPDILVNNAGIAISAPFLRTGDELWQRHLATNLSGTFYCSRAALPAMLEKGWGRVINIASIAAKTGAPYIAAYSASKHGVLGLTRSLAHEVASKGITVNAICPGYVDTEMVTRGIENISARTGKSASESMELLRGMSPQNRLVTAEEVAAMAVLLASEEGRGITGQAINIDGGTVMY